MLLVLGFVGTVVALERAVALRHPAGFAAPAGLGLGGLLLISPVPLTAGRPALCLGALAMVGVYVPLWRRQRDDAVLVQAFGAVLAAGAALLWLADVGIPVLLPWLVGFVVLTIGGERLELARLAMGPRAGSAFLALSAALVAGVVAALLWPGPAIRSSGSRCSPWWAGSPCTTSRGGRSGPPGCAVRRGVPAGRLRLARGGGGLLAARRRGAGRTGVRRRRARRVPRLHPIDDHGARPGDPAAVLRRPLPYHPAMIAPAALLHGSLALRLWAGDAHGARLAWQVGGILNITAVLLFVGVAAWSSVRAAHAGRCVMRSRFWPLRDIPAVFWLVALVVVTVAHPFVAVPGWLMIHLLLLGAVTHSIVVWSNHFAETLLHAPTGPDERRRQSWRLIALNGGVLLVVIGVPSRVWGLTLAGACLVAAAVGWHGASLVHRLRAVAALPVPAAGALLRRCRGVPPGRRRAGRGPGPRARRPAARSRRAWRTSRSTCSAGWA